MTTTTATTTETTINLVGRIITGAATRNLTDLDEIAGDRTVPAGLRRAAHWAILDATGQDPVAAEQWQRECNAALAG